MANTILLTETTVNACEVKRHKPMQPKSQSSNTEYPHVKSTFINITVKFNDLFNTNTVKLVFLWTHDFIPSSGSLDIGTKL